MAAKEMITVFHRIFRELDIVYLIKHFKKCFYAFVMNMLR